MVLVNGKEHQTAEEQRLQQDRERSAYWKRWGPYLSERQWATVREDYSGDGDAWSNFPFEHARSRVYRWGEDGIAGVSDTHQYLCLSFAFWNEKDDILKERLFGTTGHQGNHGEDVKEVYYYLDNTPTHSYMKYLYKYPQRRYPYEQLVEENQKRSREELEFEIEDTGVFKDNRYFDIFIETAKEDPEELLFRVTAYNRGPEPAPLHILPQAVFRNTWDWGLKSEEKNAKPQFVRHGENVVKATHWYLGDHYLQWSSSPGVDENSEEVTPSVLFTENVTNDQRLYNVKNTASHVKDAFHDYVIEGDKSAVNPEEKGTKTGGWFAFDQGNGIPPGGFVTVRFRLTKKDPGNEDLDEEKFDKIIEKRQDEADDFYFKVSPLPIDDELRDIQRQALAGMMWDKQFYHFIHSEWQKGDPATIPPPPERANVRNRDWGHMHIDDILSMPDKWEYPFFASWDSAFHCIPLAMIDPDFSKKQLDLLTREWYMHPNGQIPAYEWNFSDVNPPVHAWAAFRVFKIERKMYGREDLDFLERVFQKLLLNFTWWVNRKDSSGSNVFEGGFLGLDNIGLFNRSEPLPTGGTLEQADSTGWMAFYCLQMMNIALELAKTRSVYEDIASKFFEHFIFIADAMTYRSGSGAEQSLWNDTDGFYYDAISWGGPWSQQLPVRSLVGLIPLYATITLEPQILDKFKSFAKRVKWFVENRPSISNRNIASMTRRGSGERMLLALVNQDRLTRILERMLDEDEFLSDYGIRSLSKYHEKNPFTWDVNGEKFTVDYVPGESNSGMFGGNSNWRGPIWMPTNFLLIESLQRFYMFYGDEFKVECPTGSGQYKNLAQVSEYIQHRLMHLFQRDHDGRRPYNGGRDQFDYDDNFKDYILFHEYFHADSGRGLGSQHQCGWTSLVAKLIHDSGVSCSLSRTPKTPVATADHYFDEVIGTNTGHRHHRRKHSARIPGRFRSRSGSTASRSDFADDNERGHDQDDDVDISEHIRNALSLDGSSGPQFHEELETRFT